MATLFIILVVFLSVAVVLDGLLNGPTFFRGTPPTTPSFPKDRGEGTD